MSVQHFRSLLFRSTQIQQEIEKEQKRRLPNWMRLLKLKKLRLSIKDRLQEIVMQGAHIQGSRRMQPAAIRSRKSSSKMYSEGR